MKKDNAFQTIGDMELGDLSSPTIIENNNFFDFDLPVEETEVEVEIENTPSGDLGDLGELERKPKPSKKPKEKIEDLEDLEDLEDSENPEDPDLSKETEVVTLDKETDYEDYSDYALIAIKQIEEGSWDLDKKDIPKDLDLLTLSELFEAQNTATQEKIKEDVLSQVEEYSNYIKHLMAGGSPETVQDLITINKLSSLDTDVEDNQKQILRVYFELKQVDEDTIDDTIEAILDKGKGKQKTEEALSLLESYEQRVLENEQLKIQEYRNAQKKNYEDYVNNVTKIVSTGKVGGVNLSKKKQKQVLDAMFKPTEVVSFQNPQTGKIEKQRVTKSKLLFDEASKNPEKLAAMVLWLLDGGTFETVKNDIETEKNISLREILKARKTITVERPKSDNAFEILAEKASRMNF